MTAKEVFYSLGFTICEEDDCGLNYSDDFGLGSKNIYIGKDGEVSAYIYTVHEDGTPLDLDLNMLKAVVLQLREFGLDI